VKLKVSMRANVERPLPHVKQQFGYAKVRYRCQQKNTTRLTMQFALTAIWFPLISALV
jgi:IS5 family transposase